MEDAQRYEERESQVMHCCLAKKIAEVMQVLVEDTPQDVVEYNESPSFSQLSQGSQLEPDEHLSEYFDSMADLEGEDEEGSYFFSNFEM